jgi:predicted transcriptional regulator
MTPAQVQAELGGQLAYTTVMTTLSRLHRKGAIERSPAGRGFRYSLVGGPGRARSNMTAHQMFKLLEDETDRAGALTRFVAELRPEDERLLSELLEQAPDEDTPRRRPEA